MKSWINCFFEDGVGHRGQSLTSELCLQSCLGTAVNEALDNLKA